LRLLFLKINVVNKNVITRANEIIKNQLSKYFFEKSN